MAQQAMLQGIRVVDLTTVVFGPYATQTLADMGAEVIKVENPGGDAFRYAGTPAKTRGMGPCHMGLNRGKASIVLDLKAAEDAAIMRDLLRSADVFIHNVRGAAIARLGFSYEAVKALRPDIIYVHCVGFGSGGPYSDLQAYDDVIQAATGAATLASRVDGDPKPRFIPSLIADKVAGLHGAYAVLGALVHRLRTGEGQFVEAPMFEAFSHFMLKEHLFEQTFVPPTGPAGYPRQLDPHRQPFPTADGHIAIVPYTDASLFTVFDVLGATRLLQQEIYDTPLKRFQRMGELYDHIAALTPARTTAAWCERLSAANIPAMPVRDLDQMLEDPHLNAVGFFRQKVHPTEGVYVDMAPPVRFSALPDPDPRPAPLLDGDGATLRAELNSKQG